MKKKVYKVKKIKGNRDILIKLENIGSSHARGEKYFHDTVSELKKIKKRGPIYGILEGIERLSPGVRLLQNVRSGRLVHVPGRISQRASLYFAIKWLYLSANQKPHKTTIGESLASDIVDSLYKKGLPFKYKNELIQGVLAGRALQKKVRRVRRSGKSKIKKWKWVRQNFKKVKIEVKKNNVDVKNRIIKRGKYQKRENREAFKKKVSKYSKKKKNKLKMKKKKWFSKNKYFTNELGLPYFFYPFSYIIKVVSKPTDIAKLLAKPKRKGINKKKKKYIKLCRMLGNPILREDIEKLDKMWEMSVKVGEEILKLKRIKKW